MTYGGKGSSSYMGIEGTALAGDPKSDQNIPFNPMRSFIPAEPKYSEEIEHVFNSLVPYCIYSGELVPIDVSYETLYKDPFLMLTFFTEKTLAGTWSSGVGTINASFTAETELDTMFFQMHQQQQNASVAAPKHIDRLYKGVLPMQYSWIFEKRKLMKEAFTIKALDFEDVVNPMNCSNDFHDDAFTIAAIAEISTIVAKAKASIGDGDYFFIYGPSGTFSETKYYVWFDQQGAGQADPGPAGATEILCDISGATDDDSVAVIIAAAIAGKADFGASSTDEVVTVTAANGGHATDIVDVDSTLTLTVTTQGNELLGGWADWDDTGIIDSGGVTGKRSSADAVLHWNDAVLTGLNIENMRMDMDFGYETSQVVSSLGHTVYWRTVREFKITITGKVNDKTLIEEAEKKYKDKTKQTIKLYYDKTTSEFKFMQCTNAYISSESDIPEIPESGKPSEATVIIKGGVAFATTFVGNFDTLPDPDVLMSN